MVESDEFVWVVLEELLVKSRGSEDVLQTENALDNFDWIVLFREILLKSGGFRVPST